MPHFAVDVLQWRPGWQPVSKAEFEAIHSSLLTRETWIIDGFGPWEEIEKRFDRADTIIFVDHSLWRHYWWATKRQIASIFHGRADGPEGCPMLPVTFRLYRMMWQVHYEMRPRLLDAINARLPGRQIFHIRSPRELASFVERYC